MNEVSLWERAVSVNAHSAFPFAQLGEAYRQAGRLPDARRALTRALELNPTITAAHVGLGVLAVREKKWEEAERELKLVIENYPDYNVAVQQLALAYQLQGRFDEAIAVFDKGRRTMPYESAPFTVNIAVLHRMAGRTSLAQSELESLKDRIAGATDPNVLRAWWFLGELYREQGRTADMIAAYERFLRATEGIRDPETADMRTSAAAALRAARP